MTSVGANVMGFKIGTRVHLKGDRKILTRDGEYALLHRNKAHLGRTESTSRSTEDSETNF